jgi:hypothetical protein
MLSDALPRGLLLELVEDLTQRQNETLGRLAAVRALDCRMLGIGTLDELRARAGLPGAPLEAVILALTGSP